MLEAVLQVVDLIDYFLPESLVIPDLLDLT
jgi:hypothetical protein